MKTRWITLASLILLALAGCSPSQVNRSSSSAKKDIEPQATLPQESFSVAIESTPEMKESPKIPAPTVGSVVITNTTATPISSQGSVPALAPDPILQRLAQRARQDLANSLNVNIDRIDLIKIVPAKWPYDSVGCPSPNLESIDTSTPGYQILLSANDQMYMYHTDGNDWLGLCTVKPPDEIRTLP